MYAQKVCEAEKKKGNPGFSPCHRPALEADLLGDEHWKSKSDSFEVLEDVVKGS